MNHPTHSGVKQQPFHCTRGFSESRIWTEHRANVSYLLHDIWHFSWVTQNSSGWNHPASGFFTRMLVPGLRWLKDWLQLELVTRASIGSLLCGLGFSQLGSKRKCYRENIWRVNIPRESGRIHVGFTDLASKVTYGAFYSLLVSHQGQPDHEMNDIIGIISWKYSLP